MTNTLLVQWQLNNYMTTSKACSGSKPNRTKNTETNVNINLTSEELDTEFSYSELQSAVFSQKKKINKNK